MEITKVLYNARMFKVKQYYTVYVTLFQIEPLFPLFRNNKCIFIFFKNEERKPPNSIESNIKWAI